MWTFLSLHDDIRKHIFFVARQNALIGSDLFRTGETFMCGIVGAVGQRDITPILLEGLKRLEYRGYDSCGVAVHMEGELKRARSTQRVAELVEQVQIESV